MKLLNVGLTALLLLVLAACSSVTPAPKLETGVDQYGSYTVIASQVIAGTQVGAAAPSPQRATLGSYGAPTRIVQLRKYSGSRYGTWFIIKSAKNRIWWRGTLKLEAFYGMEPPVVRRLSARANGIGTYKTWRGNTGPVKMPYDPNEVCAEVSGTFEAHRMPNGAQEMTEGLYRVCAHTYSDEATPSRFNQRIGDKTTDKKNIVV